MKLHFLFGLLMLQRINVQTPINSDAKTGNGNWHPSMFLGVSSPEIIMKNLTLYW